jgi:hypothetical protein
MELSEHAIEKGALAVRLTYFGPELPSESIRQGTVIQRVGDELAVEIEDIAPPTLRHVAAAIAQADAYLNAAVLLDQHWDQLLAQRASRDRRRASRGAAVEGRPFGFIGSRRWATRAERHPFSIVSIEMRSPLIIVVAVPALLVAKYGNNLLILAERISSAPARIQRERKEEIVKTELLDQAQQAVREGRADAIALQLLGIGPAFPHLPGPSNIDFLDADDSDDDDLVESVS